MEVEMFGEKQTHHISTHQQTRTSVHGGHTKTNTQIYVLDNQNDCCCMVDHQIYSNLTFTVSGVLYYSATCDCDGDDLRHTQKLLLKGVQSEER